MNAAVLERLWTVPEIAEYLGVKTSWVYAKVIADEMPHVRVGRYVRFRVAEVDEWLMSASGRQAR